MNAERTVGEAAADSTPQRRISIVDDDPSIRAALTSLMRAIRFKVDSFGSAEEFLASGLLSDIACLILDVYLPGMNGFELQDRLRTGGHGIPIIFITAHADEVSRQRALKNGAVDLLGKPVRRDILFHALHSAIA